MTICKTKLSQELTTDTSQQKEELASLLLSEIFQLALFYFSLICPRGASSPLGEMR